MKSIEDAIKLNQIATKQDFAIYISCDNGMFDVRSLLGLFALVGKSGMLVAPDHASPEAFIKALKRMGVMA
jgi:hypothetical protein